jgi:hypothetical protein
LYIPYNLTSLNEFFQVEWWKKSLKPYGQKD